MKVPWIGFNTCFRKPIYQLTIVILLSILFTGCTFLKLREETEILQYSTILVGVVSSDLNLQDTPIMVAAYTKNENKRTIVHYTTLHEPGAYELIVPKGNYRLVAFENKNRNLIYDKGEAAGQYIGSEYVSAPAGGVVSNMDIMISSLNTEKIDFPVGSALPPKKTNSFHNTSAGAIADLDDILFSAEYSSKGLWTPVEFYKEVGGNIYFLEEYDPKKIPILFVHGAGGSPQNWRAFFDNIDREKYQPWFYYYPSGSSLVSMTHLLFWKLYNLQAKYKFKELYITAHSMGGLVSRSLIMNFGEAFPAITNLITISTPWGGEELAALGVKYSPAVVPAWKDMQPEGEFIQSIFRKEMPQTIDYYLLFGHKGNRNILRANNDNAVTIASQLDQRAQHEAKMIYGYDEDHVSILSSKQVLSQYNSILSAAYDKRNNSVQSTGNRLRVGFSFDAPKNRPKPRLALILRSTDKNDFETLIYLNPEDTGREYGPFPSGKYEIHLISSAFSSNPPKRTIMIEEGSVPHAEFIMKPMGSLMGYIVDTGIRSLQAGEYKERNEEIQIESITLKKNGMTRTIIPHDDEMSSDSDLYLSKADFVSKGAFYFFDLPAGTYNMTIEAKGYKRYSGMHHVIPGHYDNEISIELLNK